jgi:hypothetical protein
MLNYAAHDSHFLIHLGYALQEEFKKKISEGSVEELQKNFIDINKKVPLDRICLIPQVID